MTGAPHHSAPWRRTARLLHGADDLGRRCPVGLTVIARRNFLAAWRDLFTRCVTGTPDPATVAGSSRKETMP